MPHERKNDAASVAATATVPARNSSVLSHQLARPVRACRAVTRTPHPLPAAAPATRPAWFGPAAHNAWTLSDAGVDLVRQHRPTKAVRVDAQPQGIVFDIVRTALVVVDMQNDFCHPQGWFGQKGISVKPMRRPIAPIAGLLPPWRAAGGTVLWLNWGVRADRLNLPPVVQFKGKRTASGVGYAEVSPEDRGRALVPGEWGTQVVDELAVAAQDITVFKHRLSGFWDNELDSILRLRGITTLLLAGVNTDRCVFSTLQDAAFLGYDCVLLEDACSTPSPRYVTRAVLELVRQLHGFTALSTDLLTALASRPTGRSRRTTAHP